MSYFVVVAGALVPASIAAHLVPRAKLPRLTRRFERARVDAPLRLAGDGAAHLDWLWARFGGPSERPITAPYAWRAMSHASALEVPSQQPIWHADPVHFAFARDRIILTTFDAASALKPEESRELAAEASTILAGFGATLCVLDSSHWFLSFDSSWSPLMTVAFDAALGRSIEHTLPVGDAAARWRKVLTEIQIAWHQNPINQRREAAGVQTINGMWLHGGGVWSGLPRQPFAAIVADDAAVRGWGLASGLAPSALLSAEGKPAGAASALVYLSGLLPLSAQEDWDGWLDAITRLDAEIDLHAQRAFARGFGDVSLVLTGRELVHTIVIRPSDRLRVWRHNPFVDLLAETESA